MFEFFDFIVSIFNTVISMFMSAVEAVLIVFKNTALSIMFITETVSSLPPFISGGMLCLLGIAVLSLLLGSFVDF